MRRLIQGFGIALAVVLSWYGIWSWLMGGDVARVKASMAYQYGKLREAHKILSLEADDVYATGFPFQFRIAVKRATLSAADGDESFAISVPLLTLESVDSAQGTYRVHLPSAIEALYAKQGEAPEHYLVSAPWPELRLSAADSNVHCGPLQGAACPDVAKNAPLISYALQLPKDITVHMQLGNDARDVPFDVAPMLVSVPVYQPIPSDLRGPLELAVGVMREALVYKTK